MMANKKALSASRQRRRAARIHENLPSWTRQPHGESSPEISHLFLWPRARPEAVGPSQPELFFSARHHLAQKTLFKFWGQKTGQRCRTPCTQKPLFLGTPAVDSCIYT